MKIVLLGFFHVKRLLPLFVIALSLCVCPVFLRIPAEITHVFGLVEVDMFSWYRMWIVAIVGGVMLFTNGAIPTTALVFWTLTAVSTVFSTYFRTALYGAPWTHEGLLVFTGYIGLYLVSRKYGLFKGLERALDAVIIIAFIASILQLIYGNPILFPPIKYFMPAYTYEKNTLPLYSVFGSSNHLGLFCALFFPYTLVKKKYSLCAIILSLAIGCETRGAWLAIAITSMLMGRRTAFTVAFIAAFFAILNYDRIIPRIKGTFSDVHIPIKDTDFDSRAHIWRNSIPQLKKTLIVGSGPGNFAMSFPQRQHFVNVVDRPHNIYLNIWIGTGLLSLLIVSIGTLEILLKGTDIALVLSCLGFLIAGLFTDSVLSVTPYFIIFLGCLSHRQDWRVLCKQ